MKEANQEVLDRGSLPAMLADRARSATDRRLAVDAAVGLLAAAGAAILRPPFWLPLTAIAGCLGLFGLWGILDREVADAPVGGRRSTVLHAAQWLVAALGGAAAAVFGFSLFFSLLGPIIS